MPTEFTPVVDTTIFTLRPDYCALSVVADSLDTVEHHAAVEQYVATALAAPMCAPWTDGHLEAWRTAYRAFGAKPQRTPCSSEALLMRVRKDGRLPTVNAVVDLYNAVSVRYAIPVGGENLAAYIGAPRLTLATGSETFDTVQDGKPVNEAVPKGEVVWRDEQGVTCRRWNWRQGVRTRIDLPTRRAWFVLERLEPMPLAAAIEAAATLVEVLQLINPAGSFTTRLIQRSGSAQIC